MSADKADKKVLALFDFDGTLTDKDSLPEFIKFVVGKPHYWLGLLRCSLTLTGYLLGWIDNNSAKQILLQHFFKGWAKDDLEEKGRCFAMQMIPKMTRPGGFKRLNWHLKQGHHVVIVSASSDIWLKSWTEQLNVDLIATQLAHENGMMTGKYSGSNCHGEEKVRRIRERYSLESFKTIYAYGDSSGDKPMLKLAQYAFYKPFRNKETVEEFQNKSPL